MKFHVRMAKHRTVQMSVSCTATIIIQVCDSGDRYSTAGKRDQGNQSVSSHVIARTMRGETRRVMRLTLEYMSCTTLSVSSQ